MTINSPNDVDVLDQFKSLSMELKEQRGFVNLSKSKFRCLVCSEYLNEQSDVIQHATRTGHQNFGQAE